MADKILAEAIEKRIIELEKEVNELSNCTLILLNKMVINELKNILRS